MALPLFDWAWCYFNRLGLACKDALASFLFANISGSTDAANTEVELVLVLYYCKDDVAHEIRSCTRYLTVVDPTQGNAQGLIECLGRALGRLGLRNIRDKALLPPSWASL